MHGLIQLSLVHKAVVRILRHCFAWQYDTRVPLSLQGTPCKQVHEQLHHQTAQPSCDVTFPHSKMSHVGTSSCQTVPANNNTVWQARTANARKVEHDLRAPQHSAQRIQHVKSPELAKLTKPSSEAMPNGNWQGATPSVKGTSAARSAYHSDKPGGRHHNKSTHPTKCDSQVHRPQECKERQPCKSPSSRHRT